MKDAIRVLSGMYDLLVIRAQLREEFLYEIADYCDIPVINALTLDDQMCIRDSSFPARIFFSIFLGDCSRGRGSRGYNSG